MPILRAEPCLFNRLVSSILTPMNHLSSEHMSKLKERLLAEKARLEEELSTIAKQNPGNPDDWSAVVDEADANSADKNDVADAMEDLEENTGISNALEAQLKDVNDALARMDAGTYGHDEATGEPIPVERLEANPSARGNI